ncbi:hypothetical protein FPRO04_03234 [Fusarium proliferatum]|nr:hypothetical protein FPRO03_05150 [Fusarium proliferatum]KAG4269574.1 hypothetical protein FPRO04_03234 [Fusarium proliferatum]
MTSSDSVGSLLAAIATLLSQGLRILSLADKSHWGPDEHEQVHAFASALDEAKKDFQELAPLVNGQIYYETDRKHEAEYSRRYREELRLCNTIGSFKRFGDRDIAFVCDYCDGHIVWEDIENMPSIRTFQEAAASPILTLSPTIDNPHWQATAFTLSGHQEKQVVFAPVAIANHVSPQPRDWQAGLLCPYCEVESTEPQEQYDDEDVYRPDLGYEDMEAFQEHLEWQHTVTAPTSQAQAASDNCMVM